MVIIKKEGHQLDEYQKSQRTNTKRDRGKTTQSLKFGKQESTECR